MPRVVTDSPSLHPIRSPWAFFQTLSMTGLVLGFLCFYIAMTPMLLPRSWLVQAVGCGVSGAIGYAFGKLLAGCMDLGCHLCAQRKIRLAAKYRLAIVILGIIGLGVMTLYHWQVMQAMRQLMEMPNEPLWMAFAAAAIGLVFWLALVAISRWLVMLTEWLVNLIAPKLHLPIRALAWVGASILVASLLFGLTRNFVWRPMLQTISQKALALDLTEPDALNAPTSPNRSGVDGISAQPWHALGHFGQRFVSLGPTAEDISALTGRPAIEPIRVFVGLNHQNPITTEADELVAIALQELDRTNAWQRQHLVIHGTTGRGWVEEYSSLAAEYLTNGDIASVAVQYSYLPSQVSFIVDQEASSQVNQLLYQAIKQRLNAMPQADRPKLYLAGKSLGAFATQSNFQTYEQLIGEIDGAVWLGTPRLSHLWSHLVQMRTKPSTETLPIIDGGRHVRFMDYPEMLSSQGHPQGHLYQNWQTPRIVFVQYASDPIVWWSPTMLYQRPDWMREAAGRDIARVPMWLPILSLWELSLDMPASNNTPPGHGHIYRHDAIHAWQAVLDTNTPSYEALAAAIDQRVDEGIAERDD